MSAILDERIAALEMELKESKAIKVAAAALVNKINKIHAHPKYKSVWEFWQAHNHPYSGPTYASELNILSALLPAPSVIAIDV